MTEVYKSEQETIQRPKQVMAWLNPDGTFTRIAADRYTERRGAKRVTLDEGVTRIEDIFESVSDGKTDLGIVPIDNSTAGPVKNTLKELLERDDITIVDEEVIPIKHFLYIRRGVTIKDIRKIRSKDQALMQCADHINQYLPWVVQEEVNSTTEAVKQVVDDPYLAAIGSEIAALAQGIEDQVVKISGFEDNPNNVTTFVVIGKKGKEITQITGSDKTTFIASIENQPGRLYALLKEFASQDINLTKIKSLRAIGDKVTFLISVDGHEQKEKVCSTLLSIEEKGTQIKRLGSYEKSKYTPEQNDTKPDIGRAAKMIQKEVQNGNGNGSEANVSIVVFTLLNEPGALAGAIEPFAKRDINLTKIDSFPSGNFEEYVFYLSYDKKGDANENEAIHELSTHCTQLVILN